MDASKQIDTYIAGITDWRGKVLAQLHKLILAADPGITEEWKWGSPVWSHNGLVCSVSAFKDHVKINFFKGTSFPDPHKIFNAGLEVKSSRSIDLYESDTINESALKDLIRAAVTHNNK